MSSVQRSVISAEREQPAMAEHVLPVDLAAERTVLGAILLDPEAYPEISATLVPDDFYNAANRAIFASMIDLGSSGGALDLVAVAGALGPKLKDVGGAAYLSSLTDGAARRSSLRHHLETVKDHARRRELIHAMVRGSSRAAEPGATASSCVAEVEDSLLSIQAEIQKAPVKHVSECSGPAYGHLMNLRASNRELIGLTTGVDSLDYMTTGIRAGELWVLAGRPGWGKSALAVQAVVANCAKGIPVALFTPEMTREQALNRIWCQASGIEYYRFRKPRSMDESQVRRLQVTVAAVDKWPLFIDDSSGPSPKEVLARARLLAKREKIQLVVVDYLQLLRGTGRDLREQVSGISRSLASLAKDTVPVLALSQMPRPRDRQELRHRPTIYDLKESGSLEQDASTVLLLYRPTDKETTMFTGEDEVIIGKQRNGEPGLNLVTFVKDSLKFVPRAPSYDIPVYGRTQPREDE